MKQNNFRLKCATFHLLLALGNLLRDGHLDWNKNDNNVTKDLGENFWMNNIFYCYIIYG